ncbi:hypothetical protein [Paraprevotella clara]
MSQLRCNGKVPTIVFGKVARDIVACKEVVDWLQCPVSGFEDFIVIITDSAVEYEERIDAFLQSVVNGRLHYMVLDMNDSLDRQRFRNKWMSYNIIGGNKVETVIQLLHNIYAHILKTGMISYDFTDLQYILKQGCWVQSVCFKGELSDWVKYFQIQANASYSFGLTLNFDDGERVKDNLDVLHKWLCRLGNNPEVKISLQPDEDEDMETIVIWTYDDEY